MIPSETHGISINFEDSMPKTKRQYPQEEPMQSEILELIKSNVHRQQAIHVISQVIFTTWMRVTRLLSRHSPYPEVVFTT